MEHAYCWGHHLHWFWLIPPLFMVLMFVFACRMFRGMGAWRSSSGRRVGWQPFGCCGFGQGTLRGRSDQTPVQILDQRYASGEITKEQYRQMKGDIEADPSSYESGDEP